jgi:RNA polymerase sigma factor (TIGR02999 family)
VADNLTPGDVTRLLQDWKVRGSADAEAQLFALINRELVKVAEAAIRKHPARAHKIDPRELVSEAYLALREYPIATPNRGPFFRLMNVAMRHYLLDLVDRDRAAKRPPSVLRVHQTSAADETPDAGGVSPVEWYLAIDALRRVDPRQADVVELRIMGLSNDEIATEVGIGTATVKRDLKQARAFLAFQLGLPSTWLDA